MSLAPTPENIQALCSYLSLTIDADASKRKGGNLHSNISKFAYSLYLAEGVLTSMIPKPGFPLLLLKIVEITGVGNHVKLAGAVFFKNLVKNHWGDVRSFDVASSDFCIERRIDHNQYY
jgi:hypothetical protein